MLRTRLWRARSRGGHHGVGRVALAAALVASSATALVVAPPPSTAAGAQEPEPTEPEPSTPGSQPATEPVTPSSPLAAEPVRTLASTTVETPGSAPGAGARAAVDLNDNGGWCWFQDERAIFTRDGRLMVTSVPDRSGTDGVARDGGTEVTSVDLGTGGSWTDVLYKGLASDDHNAAALLELPDRTLGLATSHSSDPSIYRARLERDGLGWVPDAPMLRPEAAVHDPALGRQSGVTYSNLAYLAAENGGRGRVYDIFRSAGETLHLITSDDQGLTWRNRGRIFTRYRAYIRMVSDGQRRIWFTITDGHPDNFNGTSLYAGYIQDDAIHRSDGTRVATLGNPVDPASLTLVFRGTQGTLAQQVDAWGSDIALDGAGNPVVSFSTTIPGTPTRPWRYKRHDARYARWDGTRWIENRMGNAGYEVGDQVHYTGLSTIDPADPNRIFLSTDVHPATGALLRSSADGQVHHEIFEGRTANGGATWTWTTVTSNSRADNLRPIVPNPRDGHWALIWMRGAYTSGLVFDLDVVAIIDPDGPGTPPPARTRPTSPPWGLPSATPVVSDLDGDGRDDMTFWGPGRTADVQVSFLAGGWRRSVYRRQDAPSGTRIVTGDFDGNRRADILWHTPGGTTSMWWGSSTANPIHQTLQVRGRYVPVAGDFDGDGRDDILWYAAGSAADSIWWGTGGRGFHSTPVAVGGLYLPIVGDFDGDRRDDVLWYGPGSAPDSIWWAGTGRRFGSQRVTVGADYRAVAGDVDRDGRDEVIWHAPGSVADRRWDLDGRRVSSRAFQIWGSYRPAIGDFDGDRRDDLVWTVPQRGELTFAWADTTAYLAP